MAAENVAPQPPEQLIEHALTQTTRAARSELEMLAVALGVARLLEYFCQLLQSAHVGGRLSIEQLGDLIRIYIRQLFGHADRTHLARQLVHAIESCQLSERALQAELLAALEVVALAQAFRQERVKGRRELGQVPAQSIVTQKRVHDVLQLLALLGAQRLHERLHLRHALGELLDDVVERLRARKNASVTGQEVGHVRLV